MSQLAPRIDAFYKQNQIIDGNFDFWQRGTSFSCSGSSNTYTADRWLTAINSTAGVVTVTQSTDIPNVNSQYSWKAQVATATATVAAGDYLFLEQRIEGSNFKLVAGKTVTLSFYVKAFQSGTYYAFLKNNAYDRSYVAPFTVTASATWQLITLPITLSTTGTWLYDTNVGLRVCFALTAGATFQTGTTGQWVAGNYVAGSSVQNFLSSTSNTFQVSQVMLHEGSVAQQFALAGGTIGGELIMCQRYFEKSYSQSINPGAVTVTGAFTYSSGVVGAAGTAVVAGQLNFKVEKRTAPTMTAYETLSGTINVCNQLLTNGNRSGTATFTVGAGNFSGISTSGVQMNLNNGTSFSGFLVHWTAEAEL